MHCTPRARGRATVCAAAVALLAVPAAGLGADALLEPAGDTALTLHPATARGLAVAGVQVVPVAGARVKSGAVAFPITGGQVTSLAKATGTVGHSGGLEFRAGGKRLRVTDFQVRLRAKPVLIASVGTARVALLNLDTRSAKVSFTEGSMLMVDGVRATLTPQAARALNATFGVDMFTGGIPMGTTKTMATAYSTAVALDAGLAAALTKAGITPAPVAPAAANAAGKLVFPVSDGALGNGTYAGQVAHLGGISLTKGTTTVVLKDFLINTASAPPGLSADVAGARVGILTVSLAGTTTAQFKKVASVNNAKLTLTPAAAGLLNQTFGLGNALSGTTVFGAADVRAPIR